ncbi:MAG TPA: Rab family GTPase [Pyrinomonadaceae bacterium]|nr:Rab family GTPase [Pyrinomonadaceae bacterium]
MIQKKICMLGSFAVGKTSLVRRFVESIYTDKYHTTVGVKVDKKVLNVGEQETTLLLWDLEGAETEYDLRKSYLRGAAGYLLVADGTRKDTLYRALSLQLRAEETLGPVPFLLLLNKSDLTDMWEIDARERASIEQKNWKIIDTSAKTGHGVEDAFRSLTEKMMEKHNG